tara:strand:+ start:609 stop:1046 length:438 start_codon:yes stop_codon:yes gene_type:complete
MYHAILFEEVEDYNKVSRTLNYTIIFLILSGCSLSRFPGVYRINIEQGNILTQEMIDQLEPGMTQRQVKFILGTPLLRDSLNQNRWDYRYLLRIGNETLKESLVTIYFDGDNLSNIEGDLLPLWLSETPSLINNQIQEDTSAANE